MKQTVLSFAFALIAAAPSAPAPVVSEKDAAVAGYLAEEIIIIAEWKISRTITAAPALPTVMPNSIPGIPSL